MYINYTLFILLLFYTIFFEQHQLYTHHYYCTSILLYYILQSEAVVPQRGGRDGAEPVPHTGLPGAAAAPHYDRPQVYHILYCMVVYVVGALYYMCIAAVCSVCRVQYSHTSPSCSL